MFSFSFSFQNILLVRQLWQCRLIQCTCLRVISVFKGMHHVLEQSLTNGRVSPVTSFKSRALERFVFVLFVLEVLMHDVPQYYNI